MNWCASSSLMFWTIRVFACVSEAQLANARTLIFRQAQGLAPAGASDATHVPIYEQSVVGEASRATLDQQAEQPTDKGSPTKQNASCFTESGNPYIDRHHRFSAASADATQWVPLKISIHAARKCTPSKTAQHQTGAHTHQSIII